MPGYSRVFIQDCRIYAVHIDGLLGAATKQCALEFFANQVLQARTSSHGVHPSTAAALHYRIINTPFLFSLLTMAGPERIHCNLSKCIYPVQ